MSENLNVLHLQQAQFRLKIYTCFGLRFPDYYRFYIVKYAYFIILNILHIVSFSINYAYIFAIPPYIIMKVNYVHVNVMQLGKILGPGEPIWKYPHFECQTHAIINNILALLPRCLSNFKTIGRVWTWISRLRDFTRSCGKSSVRLVNRGPEHIEAWWRKYVSVTGLPLVHIHVMACTCWYQGSTWSDSMVNHC